MKTVNQQDFDEDDALQPQMMERIEYLIERVVMEKVFDFLNRMLENKKNLRLPVCYKSGCRSREEIPF